MLPILSHQTLQEAILAMLDPNSVAEAETILLAYFSDPTVLHHIQTLLLSANDQMKHHIITFIPRILDLYQAASLPIPEDFVQSIWRTFLSSDDPLYISTIWPLISSIVRTINPEGFWESHLNVLQVCLEHQKLLHSIVLGRRIIVSNQQQIPPEIVSAIGQMIAVFLPQAITLGDDFSRAYFTSKVFRTHISLFIRSQSRFTIDHFIPYFEIFQTIQLGNIHCNRVLPNYWKLMLEVIFHCVSSIDTADENAIQFVQQFRRSAVSFCQNQALDFGHRFDPLFAFARLRPKWSGNPAAKWLSKYFLICEMKYCAETIRQEQIFVGTPITTLLQKICQEFEFNRFVPEIIEMLKFITTNRSPENISVACIYYVELFTFQHEFPISIIVDELHQFVEDLRRNFHPIVAIAIINLLKEFPTSLWTESGELLGFFLSLTNIPDCEVQQSAVDAIGHLADRFTTEQLIEVWNVHINLPLESSDWILKVIAALLQKSEIPNGFVNELIALVYANLEQNSGSSFGLALTVISIYLNHYHFQVIEHCRRVGSIILRRFPKLMEFEIEGALNFIIEMRKQFGIDAIHIFIDSVLTDLVVIGSISYDIETVMSNWPEIINLLPFLNSDAAAEILEYYRKEFSRDPPKYLCLIGPLLGLLPIEKFQGVIEQVGSLIQNETALELIIQCFWNHDWMRLEMEEQVRTLVQDLMIDDPSGVRILLPGCEQEAFLRLVQCCRDTLRENGILVSS
jgi:hypothetical protein